MFYLDKDNIIAAPNLDPFKNKNIICDQFQV